MIWQVFWVWLDVNLIIGCMFLMRKEPRADVIEAWRREDEWFGEK